jgi:aconitate hydratase
MPPSEDPYGALTSLEVGDREYRVADLNALEEAGLCELDQMPYSIRVLLEAVIRNVDGEDVTWDHVENVASWEPDVPDVAVPFQPSRVVLQDLTGVPAVVDLAALRSEADRKDLDPGIVEPEVPIDLVIDHSVQVDHFGNEEAYDLNVEKEYERNAERYKVLKWAQQAFDGFDVVPPGLGIVHQVNLEYLGRVVHDEKIDGERWAYCDSLVGTDSHTPMIGGIGVVGWGVGGIDAEAALLGQPISMALPEVVGVRLTGELPEGATATDLVLHITERLRDVGVVDRFVEFFGPGLPTLTVEDRATIANMAPEQGSTISVFPPDEATLDYLERTGRDEEHIELVREYLEHQGLFGEQEPEYTEVVEMDLGSVTPSLAGPKEPDQRVEMDSMDEHFHQLVEAKTADSYDPGADDFGNDVTIEIGGEEHELTHGSVVVSAITSCTNTSNPTVMLAAGLLARNAVERGLEVPSYVKTSLAPGSKVVTEYLEESGLLTYLEKLGYYTVGYGCTTCIGNSGPLPREVQDAIEEGDLWTTSVLSGNRNFEARIHPDIKANYLASPPLVVAFGLAGRMDLDLTEDPVGHDPQGEPVYLEDIWPSQQEIQEVMADSIDPSMFEDKYADIFEGDERWEKLEAPTGDVYDWDPESTYIREPPFFQDLPPDPPGVDDIESARCLGRFGDTLTTDHISPAGQFGKDLPAGQWLMDHGVEPKEFNTYGSRRGNHEVMMRGTFANVRIKNELLDDDIEGGFTVHHPSDQAMTVFEAAQRYEEESVPLVVLSGEEMGTGSSRDWAAKGTDLLGIKATIAASYERIYRDNCIGMGVLPLEFADGETYESLGLDGTEIYNIHGLEDVGVNSRHTVTAEDPDTGDVTEFEVVARLQTPAHVKYVENGGVLHKALRDKLRAAKGLEE